MAANEIKKSASKEASRQKYNHGVTFFTTLLLVMRFWRTRCAPVQKHEVSVGEAVPSVPVVTGRPRLQSVWPLATLLGACLQGIEPRELLLKHPTTRAIASGPGYVSMWHSNEAPRCFCGYFFAKVRIKMGKVSLVERETMFAYLPFLSLFGVLGPASLSQPPCQR